MKFFFLLSLCGNLLSSCVSNNKKIEVINCYIDKDSLFFCEGKFINPPKFKYVGNVKDEFFFNKIRKALQQFNKNEPNGYIVIKTIFFGANTIEYPVAFKTLLDSNNIKNAVIQLNYTDVEMQYLGIQNGTPFAIRKANFRMPKDEDGKVNGNFEFEKDTSLFVNKDLNEAELGVVNIKMKKDTISADENTIKFKIDKSSFRILIGNTLYKEVENIKSEDINFIIEKFLKEKKILSQNYKFYIIASKDVQYVIVDKIMGTLTKNGIDIFKLVMIEK